MSGRFAGRQVLVTGAAHGFGRAIAIAFARQDAKVIACDIIAAEIAETARLARASASRLIEEAARAAQAEPVVAQALEAEEEIARTVEPGARARVRSLGAEGVVLELEGDWARMDFGGKRLRVRRSELEPVRAVNRKPGTGNRRVPPSSGSRSAVSGSRDSAGPTAEVNVIGQRVDEAVDAVEKALDQALLSGASSLRVIHGHGTGRLRDGLREHFRQHTSIASLRAGGKSEGGNGATILELR